MESRTPTARPEAWYLLEDSWRYGGLSPGRPGLGWGGCTCLTSICLGSRGLSLGVFPQSLLWHGRGADTSHRWAPHNVCRQQPIQQAPSPHARAPFPQASGPCACPGEHPVHTCNLENSSRELYTMRVARKRTSFSRSRSISSR